MRVTELPLNGRNPFALTNLSTGVVFAGNPQFTRPFDNGDNVNFSINGGLRQTNAWLLDGVPDDAITDTDAQRTRGNQNIAYIPTVDATQEFKIVTNFYDAQYGRTGGGVINVTTKSGTQRLPRHRLRVHAPLPIGRELAFRTTPTTARATASTRSPRRISAATSSINTARSSPVRCGFRRSTTARTRRSSLSALKITSRARLRRSLTSVPSLAERSGDFSALPVTIYDPLTTRVNPNFDSAAPSSATNPQYIRDAVPGQYDPANRFNTVGKNDHRRVSGAQRGRRHRGLEQLHRQPEPERGSLPQLHRARGPQHRREGAAVLPLRAQPPQPDR